MKFNYRNSVKCLSWSVVLYTVSGFFNLLIMRNGLDCKIDLEIAIIPLIVIVILMLMRYHYLTHIANKDSKGGK